MSAPPWVADATTLIDIARTLTAPTPSVSDPEALARRAFAASETFGYDPVVLRIIGRAYLLAEPNSPERERLAQLGQDARNKAMETFKAGRDKIATLDDRDHGEPNEEFARARLDASGYLLALGDAREARLQASRAVSTLAQLGVSEDSIDNAYRLLGEASAAEQHWESTVGQLRGMYWELPQHTYSLEMSERDARIWAAGLIHECHQQLTGGRALSPRNIEFQVERGVAGAREFGDVELAHHLIALARQIPGVDDATHAFLDSQAAKVQPRRIDPTAEVAEHERTLRSRLDSLITPSRDVEPLRRGPIPRNPARVGRGTGR